MFCTVAKPIMNKDPDHNTIIMQQGNNIMLTCDVQYAYPAPTIEWNITTPFFGLLQQNTSSDSSYKFHNNRSIEIYYQFLLEEGHIIITCSAYNIYGSSQKTFHLWENHTFIESTYMLYVYKFYSSQLWTLQIHHLWFI